MLNTLTVADAMAGRFLDAATAARGALDTIDDWRDLVPVIVVSLNMNLFRAAMLAGDLDGAEDALDRLAAETVGRSEWEFADAMLLWERGMLLRVRGRLVDAATALDSVAPAAMGLGAGIQAERAIVLAMAGDRLGAERVLDLARQIGRASPPTPLARFSLKLAEVRFVAATGGLDEAVSLAVACAHEARAAGATAVAFGALHVAVGLGAAHLVRDELMELADGMQGALVAACVAHARAAADRDAPALMAAAERFAELGYLVDAAETAAQAALAATTTGGPTGPWARRAAARAAALIESCQDLHTPAVLALTTDRLSARERQIATLAADGRSSQQIAEQLVLSVRTVDNHLQHVYAKLGVSSRQDLAGLL